MDNIVALCKRRGFVYPSSEIYGGLANTWDFGHYGVLLKNNLRDLWWKTFVLDRDDMVGIDASIILKPEVWRASGHIEGFNEALIDCKNCKNRARADHLIENAVPDKKVEGLPYTQLSEIIKENGIKCPKCGRMDWTDVRKFNQLVEVKLGVLEEGKDLAYLRGEIAQGLFLNFKNILDTMRVKIPFGIAQQGRAFRNEITLGQFVHRTFEFDLMEFEYFIEPSRWEEIFEYWKKQMWEWAIRLGINEKNLRWREHEEHERSHYSKKTMDIEYKYPFGWKEMFGIAYRTDFDLKNHSKHSGVDLSYLDQKTGKRHIPHVIEPTFGLSRLVGIVLFDAYREDEINGKKRVYLKLHPKLAPVKAAVFPLQKDEKLRKEAYDLFHEMKTHFTAEFDDAGNIGKMYRRQDEIGTPFCVTIDYESLDNNTATIRMRDTMNQKRIPIHSVISYIIDALKI